MKNRIGVSQFMRKCVIVKCVVVGKRKGVAVIRKWAKDDVLIEGRSLQKRN